jgi:hypothetical protein
MTAWCHLKLESRQRVQAPPGACRPPRRRARLSRTWHRLVGRTVLPTGHQPA